MLSTPVIFLIFNRPDLTQQVFETIAQAKPKQLLVVADGPRFPEEAEPCAQARAVIQQVDWECEVLTNFSEANLGCKTRISSGLDWAFNTVEEGIILEDDCVPHPTFFRFCAELLERYRHDTRIMTITGNQFIDPTDKQYSYSFSQYSSIWGWATWRRAWRLNDVAIKLWPEIRDNNWLEEVYETPAEVAFRSSKFEQVYNGSLDTWDYGWDFCCLINNGLTIRPAVNLVSNIGFDARATHTKHKNNRFANLPTSAINFPLRHPPYVIKDTKADHKMMRSRYYFSAPSILLGRKVAKMSFNAWQWRQRTASRHLWFSRLVRLFIRPASFLQSVQRKLKTVLSK